MPSPFILQVGYCPQHTHFPALFDPPAATLKLEQNYRPPSRYLRRATDHQPCQRGYPKTLYSKRIDVNRRQVLRCCGGAAQVDFRDPIVSTGEREAGMEVQRQAVLAARPRIIPANLK